MANPTTRNLLLKGGKTAVKALGRSRARRARKGKFYVGKRLGIPPALAPVAVSRTFNTPKTQTRRETGSEVLATLTVGGAKAPTWFWTEKYIVNLADPSLFPRLAHVSATFQKYRVHRLVFDFIPNVSTAYTGQISMAVVSDPSRPVIGSFDEAMSLSGAKSCTIWQPLSISVRPDQMNDTLRKLNCYQYEYQTDFDDIRMSSACSLMVSTFGVGNETVGNLRITYDVEFMDPHINEDLQTSGTASITGNVGSAVSLGVESGFSHTSPIEASDDPTFPLTKTHRVRTLLVDVYDGTTTPVLYYDTGTGTMDATPSFNHQYTDGGISAWFMPPGKYKCGLKSGTGGSGASKAFAIPVRARATLFS